MIPLPDPARGDLPGQLHRWASAASMRDLVAAFGGRLPARPAGPLLAWLDDFSAGAWDFRSAPRVERDDVEPPSFEPEVRELVASAARELGLVESPAPPLRSYDHLLVLGGLARACLQRSEHAARLVGSRAVSSVTALGSYRPLSASERALVPGAYEVDAFEVAVRRYFRTSGAASVTGSPGPVTPSSWTVRTLGDGLEVLAAPSSEPAARRANTADTYAFWARSAGLSPRSRILVVTSPIYVPFQHGDALRMLALPHGCTVHTVGFDPALASVPQPPGADGTERYLQEIRSAVRSLRRLHAELPYAAGPAPDARPSPGAGPSPDAGQLPHARPLPDARPIPDAGPFPDAGPMPDAQVLPAGRPEGRVRSADPITDPGPPR